MKEKIKAILHADTDIDIKIDFLKDLFLKDAPNLADEKMMKTCTDYLNFMGDRNQYLLDLVGLNGIEADVERVTEKQLWERFKDYLEEKEQLKNKYKP